MIPVEYKYVLVIDGRKLFIYKVIGLSSFAQDDKVDIYISFTNCLQSVRSLYPYASSIVIDNHTLMLHIDIILKDKQISCITTSCGVVFSELRKTYPTVASIFSID